MKYDQRAAQALATIIYYDLFDYPLTLQELHYNLIAAEFIDSNLFNFVQGNRDLRTVLDELIQNNKLEQRQGFYFLRGHEYLVPLRFEHQRQAHARWPTARRAARLMKYLPYIRAIFVSGSLAYNNTNELSDLDLLLIVEFGHIWLARLLMLGVLSLFRLRRRSWQQRAPGKICPNHIITTTALAIPFHNIYNAQTYHNLIPIYLQQPNLAEAFYQANHWLHRYRGGPSKIPKADIQGAPQLFDRSFKKISEIIINKLGFLERLAKYLQTRRIVPQPGVSVSDQALAFHPKSPAEPLSQELAEKLRIHLAA